MSVSTYHEDVCRFEVEAELAQPCPRRVRLPAQALFAVAVAVCAYLMMALIAGSVALHSGEMLWLARCGSLRQARLVLYDLNSPAPGGQSAAVLPNALADSADDMTVTMREKYAFAQNGKIYQGWTDLDSDVPDVSRAALAQTTLANRQPMILTGRRRADEGSASPLIPVRAGWWMGSFAYAPVAMIPSALHSAALLAAGILTLVLTFRFAFLSGSARVRDLLLLFYGDALVGVVRDKEIRQSGSTRYFVTCGFIALNGQIISSREHCAPGQWRALQLGDAVTIMHLPSRRSGLSARIYRHLPAICITRPLAPVKARR